MKKSKSIGKSDRIIIKIILYSSLLTGLGIISFKIVRNLLPVPEIAEGKVIGYSQFFGYPIYFDTLFFITMSLIPLFVSLIIYYINNE